MRLDKYLKVSRLIKRRTVANEACDAGRVLVNGKPAKASVAVKAGDQIEESKIEKKFVLSNNDAALRLQEIMIQIPSKYLEVSNIIIEQAKDVLDTNISDSIYVSLTDHIHMAVKR